MTSIKSTDGNYQKMRDDIVSRIIPVLDSLEKG